MTQGQWSITTDSGASIIEFTSYLSDDWRHDGKVLSSPVEQGGFSTYNKVNQPINGYVTLGLQGTADVIQDAIDKLEKLRTGVETFSIVTPDYEYRHMTLESYSRTRNNTDGACLLVVELYVKEVRETAMAYSNRRISASTTATNAKNASCNDNKKTGKTTASTSDKKTQAAVNKESESVLHKQWGRIT